MNTAPGSWLMSATPERFRSSLSSSRRMLDASFLWTESTPVFFSVVWSWRMRRMLWRIVCALVSVPPSQRVVTLNMPQASAAARTTSCACFLVPTKRIFLPSSVTPLTNLRASSSRSMLCVMSMMWMPLRLSKMYFFIFGFQRLV